MDDYTGQRTDFDILYRYRPCERYDIQLRGQSRERSGRGRPGYGGRNAGYRTYGAADPDSGRGQRTSNSYMGGAFEQRRQRDHIIPVLDKWRSCMADNYRFRRDNDKLYRNRPYKRNGIHPRGQSSKRGGTGRIGFGNGYAGNRPLRSAKPYRYSGERRGNACMGSAGR